MTRRLSVNQCKQHRQQTSERNKWQTGTEPNREIQRWRQRDRERRYKEADQLERSAVGFNAMFIHVLGEIATNITAQQQQLGLYW